MKINKKIIKKLKRIFSIYNLSILGCVILIVVALFIILNPANEVVMQDGLPVLQTNIKENEEITEDKAREIAVKQFKELNENVKKRNLNVTKIMRSDELYYYITSEENTLELKIKGGKITRINTVPIE